MCSFESFELCEYKSVKKLFKLILDEFLLTQESRKEGRNAQPSFFPAASSGTIQREHILGLTRGLLPAGQAQKTPTKGGVQGAKNLNHLNWLLLSGEAATPVRVSVINDCLV